MKNFLWIPFLLITNTFYAQVDSTGVKLMEDQKKLVKEKIRYDAKVMKENPTLQNLNDVENNVQFQELEIPLTLEQINENWYDMSNFKVKTIYRGLEDDSLLVDVSENKNNSKRLIGPSQYDSRIELFQLNPDIYWQFSIFQKSESIGMVVEKEKLNQVSKFFYTVDVSQTLGRTYNLCTTEGFYNQPVVGTGTAFIYSENSMITAQHVFERPISDYVVIFGYRIIQSDGMVESYFESKNIFYPKKIIKKLDELDVIEFSVDRNFDRPVLEWENSALLPKKGSEIYMLGHPSGLPLKVSLNASMEDNTHPLYYYTSLDSFQGNSGSPIFNFYTNKVIGILVSGEIDYKYNGNCYYSPICKIPYCKGEKVIRIEEIVNRL